LVKSLIAIQERTLKTAVTRSQSINIKDTFPKDNISEKLSKKDEVEQPIFLKNNLKTTKFRRETQ
jgi:hypothetical protein